MLTLLNFEEVIDPVILQRGRTYYLEGAVSRLQQQVLGWSAVVEGSQSYEVEVCEDESGRLSWYCSCPYDYGPVCKHLAAVLFGIRDMDVFTGKQDVQLMEEAASGTLQDSSQPAWKESGTRRKGKSRTDQALAILKKLKRDDLLGLLSEVVEWEEEIADRVIFRFGDGETREEYLRMLGDALALGTGPQGHMDYRGAKRAATAVDEILKRAWMERERGRLQQAVFVYQAVVETITEALQTADDLTGELEWCIRDALGGLNSVAGELGPQERNELFSYLVEEASRKRHRGSGWKWGLAASAAELVHTAAQREQLFALLANLGPEVKPGEGMQDLPARSELQKADEIRLGVIQRLDGDAEVRAFLRERIAQDQFRRQLVEYCMDRGELKDARQLCEERLAEPEGLKPVDRDGYHHQLLGIARLEQKKDEVIALAWKLFFNTKNWEYFILLRAEVPADQWGDFRDRMIHQLRAVLWDHAMAAELYVREEMWEPLVDLAEEKGVWIFDRYRQDLETRFPERVSALYERTARHLIEEQVNRKGYREACRYIRRMKKLGENDQVARLLDSLRKQYPNRPALREELESVGRFG